MMSDSQNVQSFFDANDAPATDVRFRLAVMARVARRRFHFALASEFAIFIAAALCLWLLSPTLGLHIVRLGQSQSNVLVTLALVALAAIGGHWVIAHQNRSHRKA